MSGREPSDDFQSGGTHARVAGTIRATVDVELDTTFEVDGVDSEAVVSRVDEATSSLTNLQIGL
jgi:hypothetical protein